MAPKFPMHIRAGHFLLLICAWSGGVSAAAEGELPPLDDARGMGAGILEKSAGAITVKFLPGEWPKVLWTAPGEKPWDWSAHAALAFDVTNPGPGPAAFGVRVDGDPGAGGIAKHRDGNGSLGPGETRTFYLPTLDYRSAMGMNGGPPCPDTGMTPVAAHGEVDPRRVVAFQFFMHGVAEPATLTFSRLRLLDLSQQDGLFAGMVDPYGQFTRADWPGKVHSPGDFAEQRAGEERELADAPSLPDRDVYGGWAGGPQRAAGKTFRAEMLDGRWWLVTPAGHLFLSFGIDTMDPGVGATIVQPRAEMFTGLPAREEPWDKFYSTKFHCLYGPYKTGTTFNFYGANLERKYGEDWAGAWRRTAVARLKSWGFNTIGSWSNQTLQTGRAVPYACMVGIYGSHARVDAGSNYWGRMHDPYDPAFAADVEAAMRAVAPHREDPWLLGYFVENELSWSGGPVEGGRYGLAYGVLSADAAGQPAKRAFLGQLQTKYGGIAGFNEAWGTSFAGWDGLEAPFAAGRKPSAAQAADMAEFVYQFARRYFTVVRDALKKQDPDHLYLGCRFSNYTEEAVRAAGEFCDVVSFNVYQRRLDAKKWAFVEKLKKPCLIGEFHFGSLDRGLFHPGLVAVPTQADRAAGFQEYIRSVVDHPAFVGAHWFQYTDEPLTGRPLDGENYNIGFVSVADRPYPEMVGAAREVLAEAFRRRASSGQGLRNTGN